VHGVRDNAIFRLDAGAGATVAEAFRDAGWQTAAFVSSFPLMSRFGLDRGFSRYDDLLLGSDAATGHFRERSAAGTVTAVESWLAGSAEAPGGSAPPDPAAPLFLWVHFFDPHAEYDAPAPWSRLPWPGDRFESGYAAEVAYTDRELGRLLARLDERRGGRPRGVCVVSDHGEGLGDHGERTHGVLLNVSTVRVPVVVRGPEASPGLRVAPVPLAAVPATLLGLADLASDLDPGAAPPLARWSGPVHSETLYPFFNFGWAGQRRREDGEWRLVAGPVDRLYHAVTDPGEQRDVAAEHPEVVAELRHGLEEEWERRRAAAFEPEPRTLTDEEVEALRSIGYLAGGAGHGDPEPAFDEGDDPVTRVALVDRINEAITLLEDDPARCLDVMRTVLADDPRNRLALQYSGRAFLRLQRPERARRALERALSVGRNPPGVYLDLAAALRALGRREGQWEALQGAIEADPFSVPARHELAELLIQDGRYAEALPLLEEALEIRPRAARTHFQLAIVYEQLDRREEARQRWERVLELRGDDAVAERARRALAAYGSEEADE
ncbi:MAG TPA: tetratricopeptide repeat protein, partial [bacterium]|nr:tetratricopeptide repeat protein [bacterium]